MLNGSYYKKVEREGANVLFLYEVSGSDNELNEYKEKLGTYFRVTENNKPLFFTKHYFGQERPLFYDLKKERYLPEIMDLIKIEKKMTDLGFDLWILLQILTDNTFWMKNRQYKTKRHLSEIVNLPIVNEVNSLLTNYQIKHNWKKAPFIEEPEMDEGEVDYDSYYRDYTRNAFFEGDTDSFREWDDG